MKVKLNLRNVVAIAICLAGTTFTTTITAQRNYCSFGIEAQRFIEEGSKLLERSKSGYYKTDYLLKAKDEFEKALKSAHKHYRGLIYIK